MDYNCRTNGVLNLLKEKVELGEKSWGRILAERSVAIALHPSGDHCKRRELLAEAAKVLPSFIKTDDSAFLPDMIAMNIQSISDMSRD